MTAKRFQVASGTAPTADETVPARDTPEAPPVPQEPAQRRAAGRQPESPPASAPPAGMSKARLQRHVAALDNAFGKAAAALADYEDSMEDLAVLVADVRRVGFPEHLITAAAARKNMEIPPES